MVALEKTHEIKWPVKCFKRKKLVVWQAAAQISGGTQIRHMFTTYFGAWVNNSLPVI